MDEVLKRLLELILVACFTYWVAHLVWDFLQMMAEKSPEIAAWVKTIKRAKKQVQQWWRDRTRRNF